MKKLLLRRINTINNIFQINKNINPDDDEEEEEEEKEEQDNTLINQKRRNYSFTTLKPKKSDKLKLPYLKNKDLIIKEEDEEETQRLILKKKVEKLNNVNDKNNNSTIPSSRLNNESINSLYKTDDKTHVFFKDKYPKTNVIKSKFKNKIKISLKKNSIERVIERNKMTGCLNTKNFEQLKQKILSRKNNQRKSHFRVSIKSIKEEAIPKKLSHTFNSYLSPVQTRNSSYLQLESIEKIKKSITPIKENEENFFKIKRMSQDEKFVPKNKIENYYFKIKVKELGKQKTQKTLKAIRDIIPSKYEKLKENSENYSIKNLSRVKELVHLKRNNFEESIKKYRARVNPESNEGYFYLKTITQYKPSFFKKKFKPNTISKYVNYKGFGFGVTRNGREINEKYDKLRFKTVD